MSDSFVEKVNASRRVSIASHTSKWNTNKTESRTISSNKIQSKRTKPSKKVSQNVPVPEAEIKSIPPVRKSPPISIPQPKELDEDDDGVILTDSDYFLTFDKYLEPVMPHDFKRPIVNLPFDDVHHAMYEESLAFNSLFYKPYNHY